MDCQPHSRNTYGRRRQDRSRKGMFVLSMLLSTASQKDPQNVIEINRPPLPVYQSVIEKTRGLAFRTQAIGAAMEKQPAPTAEAAPVIVEGAR